MSHPPTRASRVCGNIFSFLKAREGVILTLFDLVSPLSLVYTPVQQSKLKCVKQLAYRISNIKLCHIVFQITLFTRLSFQKKKSKRYSNSTQFKFFFSSLKFPQEEFQKQDTLWNNATIPRGSCPGELDSPSLRSLSAQNHSCKDIQVWKYWDSLLWKAKWIWNVQAKLPHPRQSSTWPSPFWTRKFSFSEGTHPTFRAPTFWRPPESQWLMLLVSCLKSLRNNSLFLSGSEHVCPFKLEAMGLVQESCLKTARAPVLSSPGHCQGASQWRATGRRGQGKGQVNGREWVRGRVFPFGRQHVAL